MLIVASARPALPVYIRTRLKEIAEKLSDFPFRRASSCNNILPDSIVKKNVVAVDTVAVFVIAVVLSLLLLLLFLLLV